MRRLALVLMVSGCELGPLDVAGLRCTDGRECGDGYSCWRDRCVRTDELPEVDAGVDAGIDAGFDAGLPVAVNLLANPGFEVLQPDGGVASWRASTGRLQPSRDQRSGNRAGRVYSSGTGQQMVMIPTADQPGTEFGMLFCASMWVRSETDAGVDVTLTLRDRYFDGGYDSSAGVRFTARDGWSQVKEQHVSFGNSTMQLRLQSSTRFDAGLGFLVDDAVLMRSSTSSCP